MIVIAEDIPQGDKDALVGGIHAMGGQYSPIMTKLVTHVIALSMNNAQCKIIVDKKLKCKAVLPHWLDHCLLLGKYIDEAPYTLPDAPVLDQDQDGTLKYLKDRKDAGAENIRGASSLQIGPLKLPEPISPSKTRKGLTVFRNHSFLLDSDLKINGHLRDSLTELIAQGGGRVVKRVEDADSVILADRKGLNFQEAVEARKDIGSLSWLYYLISTNKWSNPLRKLLHYPPICRPGQTGGGIRGFQDFKISVSNYTGEARVYLENLIKAAGGQFTKSLTQDNTHLITAHTISDKVEAARGWNINVVNHLWLEESYARWTIKSVAEKRYTTFPEKTNLGEVVGQTPIDRSCVESVLFPDREQSPGKPDRAAPFEPRDSNLQIPLRTPVASKKSPMSTISKTPASGNDKENLTPESRGAKDRAVNKLKLMAPDIALYDKESKRKGGVIYGGRRVTDPERIKPDKPSLRQKRKSVDVDDEQASASEEQEGVQAQSEPKRKKTTHAPTKTRYMITSGEKFGWTEQKTRRMRQLGYVEIQDLSAKSGFEVLVSPKVLKTVKFFAAIAAGAHIVGPGWLHEILKQKTSVDPAEWRLKDAASESEYDIDLEQVVSRARGYRQRGGLLRGMTIYCSEHVEPSWAALKDIIARNGGKCLPYKGRETKPPEPDSKDAKTKGDSSRSCLYLITVEKDQRIWSKFRHMAEENGYKPILVAVDWCLRVCMEQDLHTWNASWEFRK